MEAQFEGQDFVGISIVTEGGTGNPAVAADLDDWRARHGLAGPVLADPGWRLFTKYFDEAENSGTMLIGRGLDIFIKRETYAESISPEEVEALLVE